MVDRRIFTGNIFQLHYLFENCHDKLVRKNKCGFRTLRYQPPRIKYTEWTGDFLLLAKSEGKRDRLTRIFASRDKAAAVFGLPIQVTRTKDV